jgi:hypothetical protein
VGVGVKDGGKVGAGVKVGVGVDVEVGVSVGGGSVGVGVRVAVADGARVGSGCSTKPPTQARVASMSVRERRGIVHREDSLFQLPGFLVLTYSS